MTTDQPLHPFLLRLKKRLGWSPTDNAFQRTIEDFNETLAAELAINERYVKAQGYLSQADREQKYQEFREVGIGAVQDALYGEFGIEIREGFWQKVRDAG